jgi:hypothetical protein
MTLRGPEQDGWEPVKTATLTPAYGATVNGHYVEVFEFDGRWGWSMVHPTDCDARGQSGMVETATGAETAAVTAANACRGPRPLRPARRRQR